MVKKIRIRKDMEESLAILLQAFGYILRTIRLQQKRKKMP
jgi:hypothetical protein